MSIKSLFLIIVACLISMLLLVGAAALFGMGRMESNLRTVYDDRLIALGQLKDIEILMLDNRFIMANAVQLHAPETDLISTSIARIKKNIAQIDKLWAAYLATLHTPEEKILAAKFENIRNKLVNQGFVSGMTALGARDFEKMRQIDREIISPTSRLAVANISNLSNLQLSVVKEINLRTQSYLAIFKSTSIVVLIIGLIFVTWLGYLLIRGIYIPIEKILKFGRAVMVEDIASRVEAKSGNEISKLAVVMQLIYDHLVHALAEVRSDKQRIQAVLDNVDEGIILVGHDSRIAVFNVAASKLFDYTEREMVGKDINVLLNREDVCQPSAPPEQYVELADDFERREFVGVRKDCSHFPLEFRMRAFSLGRDRLTIVVARDLTVEKHGAAVQALLAEKEALLSEVHHRVKNNLQIIASMLKFESKASEHVPTQTVLDNMHGRIRSMALLHESLYRSGIFANVDLGVYLKQLSIQVVHTLSNRNDLIKLQLDLASVRIAMDQALPCGLLLNELISNSLKHGFPDGRSGEIRVELQPMDDDLQWKLRVSDTGVGLPDDFVFERSRSIGLQLISDFARQLGGCLEIEPGAATTFAVKFVPARG